MATINRIPSLLKGLASKTAIITGGANGIGAQTARLLHSHGANVVIADLASARSDAEALIASLAQPSRAAFIPANILDWCQMKNLYKEAIARFGPVKLVVANAGIMESAGVLDLSNVDEHGDLRESVEGFKVIDVNLKGALNTLRLALHHMQKNEPSPLDSSRGSIVLVASTSGYFGGTGVTGYVASKHGVIGLLRASQLVANGIGVRINAVAPFFTPTHITSGFADKWRDAGLKANTTTDVASAIAQMLVDPERRGECCLIAGNMLREMEATRQGLTPTWLGDDVALLMSNAGRLFAELGGYPLPSSR